MIRVLRASLLGCLLASAAACSTVPPVAGPPELRVLVYNIHAGKDAGGVDNLERVAALVRETRADVALLQEVDSATRRSGGVDQLAVLARATGMHGAFGSTLAYQGGQYGIAVLSRYPLRSYRVFPLPNDPPQPRAGGSREPRGALHAVLALPDGDLHVIDTHIDASGEDTWRRQEAARLVALADSLRAAGARLILGGDLNSTPESAVQALIRAGSLRDAWAQCGAGPDGTFPAAKPVKRIDYLYLTGTMRCSSARVLETDASDHRPVLVHMTLE